MGTLFEVLKVILPTIITGIFTFFITKYNYSKNGPLDKLEITYNRIYYPLYKIIFEPNINNDIEQVINKSKVYFIKYDKYIDISTKRLFNALSKCDKETKRKSIYQNYKNSIYNRNSYLRRRLGYLEPNFIQKYKYSTPSMKSAYRIYFELSFMYISIMIYDITKDKYEKICNITAYIFAIFFITVIIEIGLCLLKGLYYKIRN